MTIEASVGNEQQEDKTVKLGREGEPRLPRIWENTVTVWVLCQQKWETMEYFQCRSRVSCFIVFRVTLIIIENGFRWQEW